MEIRAERPQDAAAIREITTVAFALAEHASGAEAAIVDALREAGALTVSLVAVEAGEIVGHVAFSPVTIDGEERGWFGLGPVSVRPDRQGKGIGQALVREGLSLLEGSGAGGCVLVGYPAYYARFGFEADPGLRYDGIPAEYFMRLAFRDPVPAGQVAFHAGFGAT